MSKADKFNNNDSGYLDAARRRLFAAVHTVSQWMEDGMSNGPKITSITLDGPEVTGEGFRARIKGVNEDRSRLIAFANGNDLAEVVVNILNTYETRGVKWRPDIPWEERQRQQAAESAQRPGEGK